MIDGNEMEKEVIALIRKGDREKGLALQDRFLEEVKKSKVGHCNCPASCKFHGKCVECVIIHRGHCDHLPHCFQNMVNERISPISALTEHSFEKK